jgi:selenide,water dikinase
VLGKLARQQDPNVLVGFDKADDAGVYKISDELALVHTVDFFTPVVDDPYTFGQIAATNALSDVYAMGGRPLNALAMVCFPEKGDLAVLERILAGGLSKMAEGGCTVIGGHSIRDEEIKFGYAVTGTIHPARILANAGARAGDRLLITKAIGTGVISTAIKKGQAEPAWIAAATESMTTLNKAAAEVVTDFNARVVIGHRPSAVSSVTDVTGFGLVGHAREMALASGVSFRLNASAVPLLEGAMECVRAGRIPGGLNANREFAECVVCFDAAVPSELRTLLFDPQTAGGLLIAVAADSTEALLAELRAAGLPAAMIGEAIPRTQPLLLIQG